ncbi:hypothetical protein [Cohnella ginsengisoli]
MDTAFRGGVLSFAKNSSRKLGGALP